MVDVEEEQLECGGGLRWRSLSPRNSPPVPVPMSVPSPTPPTRIRHPCACTPPKPIIKTTTKPKPPRSLLFSPRSLRHELPQTKLGYRPGLSSCSTVPKGSPRAVAAAAAWCSSVPHQWPPHHLNWRFLPRRSPCWPCRSAPGVLAPRGGTGDHRLWRRPAALLCGGGHCPGTRCDGGGVRRSVGERSASGDRRCGDVRAQGRRRRRTDEDRMAVRETRRVWERHRGQSR